MTTKMEVLGDVLAGRHTPESLQTALKMAGRKLELFAVARSDDAGFVFVHGSPDLLATGRYSLADWEAHRQRLQREWGSSLEITQINVNRVPFTPISDEDSEELDDL